ncbi:MAG TPA: TRAP transporter fused permease subunit [Rectinemataceae bacterium]
MRKLSGVPKKILYVYIVMVGLFHIYTSVFGNFEAYLQRSLHLSMVLPLAYLLWPVGKKAPKDRIPWYDALLALLSFAPGVYIVANYWSITTRIVQVDSVTPAQLILGILLVILLLEGARRVVGLPITIIGLVAILYMLFGDRIPGLFQGISFSLPEVVEQSFLTDEGIFSSPLGVSATYVMVFLIFGGFLEKTGVGAYFMDLAQAFTGTQPGGPALIAVTSSCLFGSISGSAVANVYGTGTFTIPLMKKIGYQPHFAGAVEAVASTGGQIMPPVMGAGAFLMASFLGLPYKKIMIAALLPALMYYGAVFLMVRLAAHKNKLKGLSPEDLPSKRAVVKKLYMITPLAGIVYFLLSGSTPMKAAIMGIVLCWITAFFVPKTEDPGKRKISYIVGAAAALAFLILVFVPGAGDLASGSPWILAPAAILACAAALFNAGMSPRDMIDSIYQGAKDIPLIAIACATAGIVLGAVALTGIGGKLVGFVLSFAKDVPILGLVLIMLISIFLGMGLPTTGAYILAAALGAPILVKMGFSPLASHMFVFYFAVISNITPPVALACFAASSISGAKPNTIGFTAMRLGFLAFIVPFAFCYDPGLLMEGGLAANLWAIASGAIAIFAFGYFWMGFITRPIPIWLRALLLGAGVYSLFPGTLPVFAGGIVTIGAHLYSKFVPAKAQAA